MQELFKQYLDRSISRSALLRGLSSVGLSVAAADAFADALAPAAARASEGSAPTSRVVTGTGGTLFVQQLKAAGVKYYFFNPSSGDAPIFDAIADEPSIQLIKGLQEGVVVAMADGYARLTNSTAVCSIADVGLPNGLTQIVNSFKDHIPLILAVSTVGQERLGRDGFQDYDHQENLPQFVTKWSWQAQSAVSIPETVRRAWKFASTAPAGPVFLALPGNELSSTATATVIDGSQFNIPLKIRPDAADVMMIAKLLVEAKNPLLIVGDEVTRCRAESEVFELATLLGLPVAGGGGGELGSWSKPFPTSSPLYLGTVNPEMRFPGHADIRLNIGNRLGEVHMPGEMLISIRLDPTSLARTSPVDHAIVADAKLATADIIAAIKSIATIERLQKIALERTARVSAYTAGMAKLREAMLRDFPSGPTGPITLERLAFELERALDRDAIYVNDVDSGKKMDPFMSFGGNHKTYVANGPNVLGWGMSAALGAKLAQPDRQVVAVLGDGAFLFGGPQPLWSQARYNVPVTNIVLNNFSYNNERNRIWSFDPGTQFKTGRDMTCYNGSPDVDFSQAGKAFGVDGELVKEPTQIAAALARARRANIEGRPYLLDVHVQRDGIGAGSMWHPPFSVADLRKRKI